MCITIPVSYLFTKNCRFSGVNNDFDPAEISHSFCSLDKWDSRSSMNGGHRSAVGKELVKFACLFCSWKSLEWICAHSKKRVRAELSGFVSLGLSGISQIKTNLLLLISLSRYIF